MLFVQGEFFFFFFFSPVYNYLDHFYEKYIISDEMCRITHVKKLIVVSQFASAGEQTYSYQTPEVKT